MPKLPLSVWAAIVLAIANVSTGLWGWHELDRARVAEAKLETKKTELAATEEANDTLRNTMGELRAANDANAKKAKSANASAAALAARVTAIGNDLAAANAKAAQLRSQLYATDAKLRAWGDQPVPDSLAVVLRDRWAAASGPDGNGDGHAGPLRIPSG